MEHKELKTEIDKIVTEELDHARAHFPAMASGHEGYAIILEEYEEMQSEITNFDDTLQSLWRHVKANNPEGQCLFIEDMIETSKNIIKEAVQVAVMCQRYQEDVLDIEQMKASPKQDLGESM